MTDPRISHSTAGEREPLVLYGTRDKIIEFLRYCNWDLVAVRPVVENEPSFVWITEGEDRYWLTGRVVKGTRAKDESDEQV